jgi:DNA polymerase V
MLKTDNTIKKIYKIDIDSELEIPLYLSKIKAGFPSPADDYIDKTLDLNKFLIKHPSASFFVRVSGDSMVNAGIINNDIVIVDKSLEPKNNDVVIASIDGELTLKRFSRKGNKYYLVAANENFSPVEINGDREFEIWGVVTYVIHSLRDK